MCFVWLSEQAASFALNIINIDFYKGSGECLLRGKHSPYITHTFRP